MKRLPCVCWRPSSSARMTLKQRLRYARQAYASEHQVPTDVLLLGLALEASGDLDGARAACAEAMTINDQMPGVRELHQRLQRQ